MLKITSLRSKVKSKSHQQVAHLYPPTIVPFEYRIPTSGSFGDKTRFCSSTLPLGHRLNQGYNMVSHTYISQPIFLSSINFLHLKFSGMQPGQNLRGQSHHGKVKG